MTHCADVLAIAKGYIDVGADIILTNSFGASPLKLAHYRLESLTADLNKIAARISREAAGEDHFVMGSIGPTGAMLSMGNASEDELYEGFCIQAKALAKGGADALCIETMIDPDEASLAIKAARETTNCEIACTFTFGKSQSEHYYTMMGLPIDEAMETAKEAGADIIGTNCGNGIDGMIDIVHEIRKTDKTTPVLVQANAGLPVFKDEQTIFKETPEQMAEKAADLIEAGVNIIGGCCGTTPDHIKALVRAIKNGHKPSSVMN